MNLKADGGWSRQQTLKLINELKQRVLLYKVTHPDYLQSHKKQEALEEIAVNLQNVKPHVTAADVRKKIKILKQQIFQEKKKMRAAIRIGMSADDIYVSKLWCFKELNFLLYANDEISGQSNLEYNTGEPSVATSSQKQNSSTPSSSKKRKHAPELKSKLDDALEKLIAINKEVTIFETFGQHVGKQIKEFPEEDAYEIMAEIQAVISKRKVHIIRKKTLCITSRTSSDPLSQSSESVPMSNVLFNAISDAEILEEEC